MKQLLYLCLFLFMVSCSETTYESVVYETASINSNLFVIDDIYTEESSSTTEPDITILVDDITEFTISGSDLEEFSFNGLTIELE